MALQLTPDERKDRVIQQQLDVIRTLTAGNLSRMSTDFWGPAASPKPPEKAPGRRTPPHPAARSRTRRRMRPKRRTSPPSRRSWPATSAFPP